MAGTHQHGHQHGVEPGDRRGPVVTEWGAIDWDATYSGSDRMWSGNPNAALVAEVGQVAPGTAVDIGCGEGADAVWLARQGWRVSAFDVSSVAIDRAQRHADEAGVQVAFRHGGLLDVELDDVPFDLVSAQYPVLLHEDGRSLAALLDLVAPGGTLLFVHHGDIDPAEMREHGIDPDSYLQPPDVRAALETDPAWRIEVYAERERHVETGAGAGHTTDVVLRAKRVD